MATTSEQVERSAEPALPAPQRRSSYVSFVSLAPPRWKRAIALAIIAVQAVWAIAIPIKNVVMMTNPEFRADSMTSESHEYTYLPTENATIVVPGSDLVPLLRSVLAIALGQHVVRENFESVGSFDLDTAYQLLSPENFHVIARYYSVLLQATDFPGSVMTPRSRHFSTTDSTKLPSDALGVWIRPTDTSKSDWFVQLSCAAENAKLSGTRCFQGNTTHVCFDFPVAGEVRWYEPVTLDSARINSGLANNIGQLHLIERFHATMSALFSTKSWEKALTTMEFATDQEFALENGYTSAFTGDGHPLVLEKRLEAYALPIAAMNTTNLESCVMAEIMASQFYIEAFVLELIQSALIEFALYKPGATRIALPNQTHAMVAPVLAFDLHITSGARYESLSSAGSRQLAGVPVATVSSAAARFKLDSKVNGEQALGSSIRMLMYMAYYPEYYSYMKHEVQHTTPTAIEPTGIAFDAIDYSILGSASSGLNTFKQNWWGNTMGAFRLHELPFDPVRSPRVDTWWDDEVAFASWFARLERTAEAPFLVFDAYLDIAPRQIVVNDDPVTACHRAFFKTLTKVAFLSLLSASQLSSHAVFMSNINGGASTWFRTAMLRTEMYGELTTGDRIAFSYFDSTSIRKDDGSAWVAVPMFHAMLRNFGTNESLRMLLAEYNSSFAALVTTEHGYVHFPDMGHCRVGFSRANISAADNVISKIVDKLYPSVALIFADLLDAIPALHTRMASELESSEGVKMVALRDELLRGSPAGPASIAVMGSPVFWTPTAFTVGMLKFWPRSTPPLSVIEMYRNATTCYATLELRYLNESVRCWVEPSHVRKTRIEHKSVLMGKIVFSIWSTSLVLNAIASFIAAGFIQRLATAWRITRFRDVSIWVALQLNFQGFGVLSFAQTLLLTLSTVPLLVGYHIPVDNVFIVNQSTQEYSKLFKDVLVTMSVSWFYRLGFEVANHFVVLTHVSFWFSNFRLRVLSSLLVLMLRIATPDRMHSSEYEFGKLLTTCFGAMALGAASALLPMYRHRHPTTMVVPMDLKSQSIVVAAINKHDMPLNKFGLVGYSRRGWSLTGLIVEGWQIVKHTGKEQFVAVKGICRIPLAVDEHGKIKSLL